MVLLYRYKPSAKISTSLLLFLWLAVALMVAALAATALPSRIWRAAATAGLALAAAIVLSGATILARQDAPCDLGPYPGGLPARSRPASPPLALRTATRAGGA